MLPLAATLSTFVNLVVMDAHNVDQDVCRSSTQKATRIQTEHQKVLLLDVFFFFTCRRRKVKCNSDMLFHTRGPHTKHAYLKPCVDKFREIKLRKMNSRNRYKSREPLTLYCIERTRRTVSPWLPSSSSTSHWLAIVLSRRKTSILIIPTCLLEATEGSVLMQLH